MRLFTILIAIVFASSSVYAQGRGNGQVKKPAATTAKAAPRTSGAKTKPAAQPAKTAAKAERRVVKVETRAAKTAAKAETRAAKTETKAARKSGAVTTTPTTVVTPTTPTTRAVKNPKLEARLVALLPAGTNIQDASQGFKNWGHFVAAVHVSKNLNIPFADLKTAMTGFTPGMTAPATTGMSLGQAIQSLQGTTTTQPATMSPNQIRTEVKKAEDAATVDLRRSSDGS